MCVPAGEEAEEGGIAIDDGGGGEDRSDEASEYGKVGCRGGVDDIIPVGGWVVSQCGVLDEGEEVGNGDARCGGSDYQDGCQRERQGVAESELI